MKVGACFNGGVPLIIYIMIAVGGWIALCNWQIVRPSVRKRLAEAQHGVSAVPFFGGISLAIGIALLPCPLARGWWLAFFVDFGSIPGLAAWLFRRLHTHIQR